MRRVTTIATILLAATPALATDYVAIRRTAEVATSADAAWARIRDYCFIGQLLAAKCEYTVGTGDVGTIRRLNGTTLEPQVARTPWSYTYSQIEGTRAGLDYHGTLAVEPIDRRHARIVYTLVLDQDRLPAGTDKAANRTAIETRFQGAVDKAKALIEAR